MLGMAGMLGMARMLGMGELGAGILGVVRIVWVRAGGACRDYGGSGIISGEEGRKGRCEEDEDKQKC